MRQLDAEYRLDKNIKIAMLYLEDDDAVSAEAFIKKASALIGSCKARTVHPSVATHHRGLPLTLTLQQKQRGRKSPPASVFQGCHPVT